jgi:hypothetical protein
LIIDTFDQCLRARRRAQKIAQQREIDFVVRARIARRVHQLDREIDALGRRIGALRGHDVLLAQDRDVTLDDKTGPLIGIGHDAIANQDALVRLELDAECHGRNLPWLSTRLVNQT